MTNNLLPESITLAPDPAQRQADFLAAIAAHDKLDAKLQQYGRLLGQTPMQVTQGSLERGGDSFRNPASNAQRVEAYELATCLEASLPDHAGTSFQVRARLIMVLLDPAGCDQLTSELRKARYVLGI